MVDHPTLVIKELRGRSACAIALAIPFFLLAQLLPGTERIAANAGILVIVGLLLDYYRFVIDPVGQTIRIQTLWLGWRERSTVSYRFSDVVRLEKATLGDATSGYRWKFRGGATYELFSPLDEWLYVLFREKEALGVLTRPGTADYAYGPQWWLAQRGDAVVLEPNVGEALGIWSFCGVVAVAFTVLAARGSTSPAVALGSVAVCGGIALLVALYVKSEAGKGPWLHFDRARGSLILPRWEIDFDTDALVAWETQQVHWDVAAETIRVTELRLLVGSAGAEKRYVLLACRNHVAVQELMEELAKLMELPRQEAIPHGP